jgi:UDP-N-acetylmuramoyl-L-alanyl-D-glutamate--2,6-diaminopimelate ligase
MLFSKLAFDCERRGPDVELQGLARDSREVKKGFLFVAITGEKEDGRAYIKDALASGATALLLPAGTEAPEGVPVAFAAEPRRALALFAKRFYAKQPETMAAVTGTSGKTSTVQFARQIWQHAGHKAAAIGTLGIIGTGIERYGAITTPDAITLMQDLRMLAVDKGITHVAMEASSHGLDQFRLDGVKLNIAAFTNFSRDHLDYHKTMESYFDAKMRLFNELLPADGTAVINCNAAEYEKVAEAAKKRGHKPLTFGCSKGDIRLAGKEMTAHGQMLRLSIFGKKYEAAINLVGEFQSMNVMCAMGMALASGETEDSILAALPRLQGVRGRMEWVGNYRGGGVYVDYAHKPDAMENVLQALRPHTQGRLITVFGCGGNRDMGKRPIMGEIAMRLSDIVIVTDDNPRLEDPTLIRKEVMAGAEGAKEIGDRAKAIGAALEMMQPGDVLVIAGKGHEQGQIVGKETLPFDDAEVARHLMQGEAA